MIVSSRPGCHAADARGVGAWWPLSDGEIHYLWWFIQGSIMDPGTRWRLRRAWGLCERHAWGALAAEAAFRPNFLHGPAILYEDLLERALHAFELRGPWQTRRLAWGLRVTGPCLMCEMGLGPASRGTARAEIIERGRDSSAIRAFADRTREHWWKGVCGRCLGGGSAPRCRPHLLEAASRGSVIDLPEQRALVEHTLQRLAFYCRSFVWDHRNTETEEDRAALISAVGWCTGWRGLLVIFLVGFLEANGSIAQEPAW